MKAVLIFLNTAGTWTIIKVTHHCALAYVHRNSSMSAEPSILFFSGGHSLGMRAFNAHYGAKKNHFTVPNQFV